MTLCKYRPLRTYDAQYIFEQNDVNGLLKKLREAVALMGDEDASGSCYYTGALIAFEVMFDVAESTGEVDTWADFLTLFESALNAEGGE